VVVFAGQGDARRSMALLWRTGEGGQAPAGPGPRPGLTVDEIVAAAIAVADEVGMTALSMRAVGERLGRTAMALYTYVHGRSELVDLMYDRTLAELPTSYALDAGWRPALTAWAHDSWAFYVRHPWMLQVSQARPVLGPGEFGVLETLVGILRETHLEVRVLRGVVGALTHHVRGSAQTMADSRAAAAATGVSDQDWWFSRSPLLAEVAPDFAERFPMTTWIESDAPQPPEDEQEPYLERAARQSFQVGLAVLLDGIETATKESSG
jgi:AcrR family transcriptional regulator